MSNSIGSVNQAQVPPPSTAPPKAPSTSGSEAAPADTVQLSAAALAALQEARETPAQTAKEAGHGDLQAKHLLAKQASQHEVESPKLHVVA